MTAPATLARPTVRQPHVVLRGKNIPVVLPDRRDPRFKLSAVIMTLHVLGQTVLGFKVSIAQILVSIAVCAVVEAAVTFRSHRILVWPASGILTGSSVAFILRASGTPHGDWWSLRGIQFFVLAGLISLLSKHLIRPGGRHLFNPSNVGIVWCLLVIGPNHVFAQYLWWGPNQAGVTLSYAVILLGAVWILRSVRMVPMAVSFMATFAALIGVFALSGRSFIAIWHEGPVGGLSYWLNIATSPELLVFVFFMISDPQTAPRSAIGRVIYGAATALVAAGLIFFQPTEFGIKVAILSSLTVVCALVPLIEAWSRRLQGRHVDVSAARGSVGVDQPLPRRLVAAARNPAIVAALIIAVAAPVDTAVLSRNKQVILIEHGQVGAGNAQ
jgi:Na+-translocating ferredoxin:NAD+ oxidoreductase RnfD subunit